MREITTTRVRYLGSILLHSKLRNAGIAAAAGLAALAFVFGLGLTRSLTSGTSTVTTDIRWEDYYRANDFLRTGRPGANVFAASGEGVVLPMSNEVTTTVAPKLAILAHQKVNPETRTPSGCASEEVASSRI